MLNSILFTAECPETVTMIPCSPFFSAFFKPINTQGFSNLVVFKVFVVQGFHAQLQEPL